MISRALLVCFLFLGTIASRAAELPPFKPGESVIQFRTSATQSRGAELKSRLHALDDIPPFYLIKEKFRIIVPKEYTHKEPWGLFIWVSPGNTANIPKDWEAVLAKRKLIFIGANNSGNRRNIFDRFRMAVDANHNMRQRFNIDGRRVYVSGFSGGGRVASMLAVAYADMFSGTIAWMGVNFYEPLPAGGGSVYNPYFIPDDEVLAIAKKNCRFVLVTGEKDFNLDNTRSTFVNGFQKHGFSNAHYLEIPNQGHRPPGAEWLKKALDLLEQPEPETKSGKK